jgi:transcriptional regulator with XRE-family HTH domain
MGQKHDAPKRLRRLRKERGLSIRATAAELNTSHPSISDWEHGKKVPSKPYREAIERWSKGLILEAAWPLHEREREAIAKAASVEPFKSTGT